MTAIVTKRLMLRADGPFPLGPMVGWLNDPAVVKYSEQRHLKHSVETQDVYIRMFGPPNHFRQIYAGDAFIGTITAHVDENNSVANVGILIGEKKEWGKGYGTEAWQAFCDHLLGNGIRKIEAGCMNCNHGMIRIFEKTGMYFEGRRSGHFQLENGLLLVDLMQYGRFI